MNSKTKLSSSSSVTRGATGSGNVTVEKPRLVKPGSSGGTNKLTEVKQQPNTATAAPISKQKTVVEQADAPPEWLDIDVLAASVPPELIKPRASPAFYPRTRFVSGDNAHARTDIVYTETPKDDAQNRSAYDDDGDDND